MALSSAVGSSGKEDLTRVLSTMSDSDIALVLERHLSQQKQVRPAQDPVPSQGDKSDEEELHQQLSALQDQVRKEVSCSGDSAQEDSVEPSVRFDTRLPQRRSRSPERRSRSPERLREPRAAYRSPGRRSALRQSTSRLTQSHRSSIRSTSPVSRRHSPSPSRHYHSPSPSRRYRSPSPSRRYRSPSPSSSRRHHSSSSSSRRRHRSPSPAQYGSDHSSPIRVRSSGKRKRSTEDSIRVLIAGSRMRRWSVSYRESLEVSRSLRTRSVPCFSGRSLTEMLSRKLWELFEDTWVSRKR